MYLKSLEIQGFKSFPDKVSLAFDKGLTAVVGPNGSGKSNIGDSVRWVLGEQSTKTLRGSKMEDIIFSGTVTRKPMGFAVVTLNIDNSDNTLDGFGADVAITRKLYKSGESEYSINGKSCRLKDINELFMDTGLGRDGYSIIGQGRIAEIVGAKSSERRDIFEEAAGISKFRYKKAEAERKLKAAQENIVRLSDIISELETRIEPLRIQSEKAKKFLVLSEKRKNLEISVWVAQLAQLREKLNELDEKILASKSEYEHLENDIKNEEEKLQKSYRKMQECTMKSDELQRKMIAEEQEASQKKSDIAVFENDIKHCNESIESARKSIEESAETKKNYEKKIRDIRKKIAVLQEKREKLKAESAETERKLAEAENINAELGKSAEDISKNINNLHIKQSELKIKAESARQTVISEEKRLDEIVSGSNDIEKTIAEYNEKIGVYSAEIEKNNSKKIALNNKLAGLEKLYQLRKKSFDDVKEESEKNFYELKNCQQKQKILSELENSMEGFSGSVKQILKASKQGRISGISGTVAQNISVSSEYATAIETALGGAMQNIIVENEETAKRCIRFLKEQKGGRATFLPLTSVRGNALVEKGLDECEGFVSMADGLVEYDEKFRGVILSLLGRIAVAEDIDTATLIAKKFGYKFRIVTLDGQVINAGGSFTGGSVQKSAGIITRKNEIETLESEIKRLTELQKELDSKTEKFRSESDKLRYDSEMVRSEIKETESEEVRKNAELSTLRSLIAQLTAQTENTEKQIEETKNKIESAKNTESEAEKTAAEICGRIGEMQETLQRLQKDREKIRLERAECSQKISEISLQDVEVSKDIQIQEAEILRMDSELEKLSKGNEYFENEISRQNNIIYERNESIRRIKAELEDMKNNSGRYMEEIRSLQNIHNEQQRIVNEIQKGIRQINDAKEKFSGDIARLSENRETTGKSYDSIIQQLLDVYEMTYSEAVKIAEKIDDMLSAQSELGDIKAKIRSLGSVNVEAIDEYAEVSERYNFMSGQLDDVQKSKAELEKIIDNLMNEMKRIFSESFSIINSNFKSVFTELFGGGKAELILTDPENVLESGIEISVAPPGKVIKNLISLSGGEQAFVAIAIYFAILKLRPAPFCILDEIDAALDEVNVRKYAQYLKKFTDTTQFVLVTHRRSAMEEANVLYGVTMQEDGISKLLKMEQVDFQEDMADIQ